MKVSMNLMSLMIFVEKQESRKSRQYRTTLVAERKNRTIYEAAKAMVIDLDLPLSLWVEAAGIAVYIQHRNPHAILG